MTQLDSTFGETGAGQQKTSGLAVGSLVCSLICCLPGLPLIGALLGVGALVSIGNDPARRGKGLAIAGLAIGGLLTLAQIGVGPKLYQATKIFYEIASKIVPTMETGPRDALNAGFSGDVAGFKDAFHGAGATAPDADAQAFIETLRARYGDFVDSQLAQQSQGTPPTRQPSIVVPYVLEFENAQVDAQVEIILLDTEGPDAPQVVMKLGSIEVLDEQRGDVKYPPEGGVTPSPPPESPPESAPQGPDEQPPVSPGGD